MSLPTPYQSVIHLSRYARWNDSARRREYLPETVGRYVSFFQNHLERNFSVPQNHTSYGTVARGIVGLEVMPSMRCMMSAGPALEREHMCGFNCTYMAIDRVEAFAELMYISMCGSGVGFSVERQHTGRLPMIPRRLRVSSETIIVPDSRLGWATSFERLLRKLYAGEIPGWDTSQVRPRGSRLKTMGGTASGPEPLIELFRFVVKTFENAKGRRLSSLECHDICCKTGDIVQTGGVRRSALLSLSNLSDLRMRDAKSGAWYQTDPHRAISNNSVAYTEKPTVGAFMDEWLALYNSKSGERGIFNRVAAWDQARQIGRRAEWDNDEPVDFGANPCGEIILRDCQTCNLTEVVARPEDTFETLKWKVELATIMGTWQSTLTRYGYVSNVWRTNSEEERLLGVSITGIMDCPLLNGSLPRSNTIEVLQELRRWARHVNLEWAGALGIPASKAITCVKPSGTVSQLVGASSGIHARYAPTYLRRIRFDANDPVFRLLRDQGYPWEPDVTKPEYLAVVTFPMRSPEGAIFEGDRSVAETLDHWLLFREAWTDHNPSITVHLDEGDWPRAGAWVWDNWDKVCGLTFLPKTDHVYQQAPYEAVSEEQLREFEDTLPNKELDFTALEAYEAWDNTETMKELACTGGACELT